MVLVCAGLVLAGDGHWLGYLQGGVVMTRTSCPSQKLRSQEKNRAVSLECRTWRALAFADRHPDDAPLDILQFDGLRSDCNQCGKHERRRKSAANGRSLHGSADNRNFSL